MDGAWRGRFYGLGDVISARSLECYAVLGDVSIAVELLSSQSGPVVMLARAEMLMFTDYGGKNFWEIRRR